MHVLTTVKSVIFNLNRIQICPTKDIIHKSFFNSLSYFILCTFSFLRSHSKQNSPFDSWSTFILVFAVCQVWRTFSLTCSNSLTRFRVLGYPIRPRLTELSSLARTNQFAPSTSGPDYLPEQKHQRQCREFFVLNSVNAHAEWFLEGKEQKKRRFKLWRSFHIVWRVSQWGLKDFRMRLWAESE